MQPTRAAKVARIFDHNRDTRSLLLAVDGSPMRWKPGQFISIAIPLPDETRTRAYTIASPAASGGEFEIVFNRVANGRGVEWLFARNAGDAINFTGPYGSFAMESAPAVETIFIAEGTAIAPIRPMLHRAFEGSHSKMTLLYAAASEEQILYRDEFESFAARDPSFRFEALIVPQDELYERLKTEASNRWVSGNSDRTRQFYLCGIGKGVITLRDLLRGAGYERRAVHYEQW